MNAAEAKAQFAKQIDAAQKKIKDRAKLVGENKDQVIVNACLRVEGLTKRLMRATYTAISYENPKTGRLVINTRPRSVPGAAPAPEHGTLMRSITHDVEVANSKTTGRVGSTITNPPYPLYLEFGTEKMAARPSLGPAVEQSRRYFQADVRAAMVEGKALAEVANG